MISKLSLLFWVCACHFCVQWF